MIVIAALREAVSPVRPRRPGAVGPIAALANVDPATMVGAGVALIAGGFALRVVDDRQRRLRRARAEAHPRPAGAARRGRLDDDGGGRPSCFRRPAASSSASAIVSTRTAAPTSRSAADRTGRRWGAGGRAPLLCFDGVVRLLARHRLCRLRRLQDDVGDDPDRAQMGRHPRRARPIERGRADGHRPSRRKPAGRSISSIPKRPDTGFNVLDWIGRFGGTQGRGHRRRRLLDHERQRTGERRARRLLPRLCARSCSPR